MSWSESNAQVCEERSTQAHKVSPRHVVTVDLGNTSRMGTYDPLSGSRSGALSLGSPVSAASPLGSVFEEDEKAELRPMLEENEEKSSRESFKSGKHKLERQEKFDKLGTSEQSNSSEANKLDQVSGKQGRSGGRAIKKTGNVSETDNL